METLNPWTIFKVSISWERFDPVTPLNKAW